MEAAPGGHSLHPQLRALLGDQGWEALTVAQDAAFGPVREGRHVLLVAPTGHGKTEAAMLPVLDAMLAERDRLDATGSPWPQGFKALYVTPLRALNRDLLGRLTSWADALGLRIGVRHGDTPQAERTRQSRNPPDILITTPETAQLLLYGDTLRRHLATVRFVILDEVHDMAASERGAQLMVALERMEEVIGQPRALREAKARDRPGPTATAARTGGGFRRIALSATIADADAVARWVAGRDREVQVVTVRADKRIALRVVEPVPNGADHAAGARWSLAADAMAQVRAVRELVAAHRRVLVFQNTRDGAELMTSRSAAMDADAGRAPVMELHHGSLSPEHRADVEDRFKRGDLRALVATSSLELGIDVGAIDHVVQVQSPRSVARLVQRLGRAGHRVGAVSEGTLVAAGPEDILECIAVAEAAVAGRLEPLSIPQSPLVVLANQFVAMSNEYAGLDRAWCRAVVGRAGPFLDLDDDLFDATWDCLLDVKTLFPDDADAHRLGRSGRGRRHFLDHVSLIPDEKTYRIMDEATKRAVGTVDDAFVAAGLDRGALFVMAGRSWQVLDIEREDRRVRVAPAKEIGAVPQWTGSQLPVSREVAGAVATLRRRIMEDAPGDLSGLVDAHALAAAREPLERHVVAGLRVPDDRNACIEGGRRAITIHVPLGTRGNEALGRITQALLHQRLGAAVGLETDAYRIHLRLPEQVPTGQIEEAWRSLDPDALDVLLGVLLQDSPVLRHHLVHVAKHFGALPPELAADRTSRARVDALLSHVALQEEALRRLLWDRLDLEAVADFLRNLDGWDVVHQALGPMARLGQDAMRRMVAAPRHDEALVAAVRTRIEGSDAMLACCGCGHTWHSIVRLLPRAIRCRRCQGNQVACLRPWHEEEARLLRRKDALFADERKQKARLLRNGELVAGFGSVACRALVARGVGPDTAVRILQKSSDPEAPTFWREILEAELQFARTSAFWK